MPLPDLNYQLLLAVFLGIDVLLILILRLRIQAFISLLIASIVVGLVAGMPPGDILHSMQTGMGNTLGFVATVVGLGAMFGAILENTGGARSIANFLLAEMGVKRAPLAMAISGFVIAIPVFFDVAFIILTPIIYSLQRKTGKSLLLYAIPLLAGLAITHTFIPPTPGPVAVADVLDVSLGSVIVIGAIAGVPTLLICGIWYGKFISKKIFLEASEEQKDENTKIDGLPPVGLILAIIATPILLIVMSTLTESGLLNVDGITIADNLTLKSVIKLLGHPFTALIISNIMAWYLLGRGQGLSKEQLFDITTKSMAPAGTIILLTGAGGVFKQILIDTEAGAMMANLLLKTGIPLILFAFLAAALIRVIQGSATVAMLTAAGIVAPLVGSDLSEFDTACLVIAIASGASVLSHVNDSGFWLVGQYLGMSEKQTALSWSVMTTLLAITGFATAWLLTLAF
ncbi:MAG: gluconate:H+ symporter [Bacteroidota bacterium]